MSPSVLVKKSTTRTPSPYENYYDSYENTRENTRGERLLNEYNDTTPLNGLKRMPQRQFEIAPDTDAIISRIRFSLRLTSLFVAASIIGVLGHFSSVYLATKDDMVLVQERYGRKRVWPRWLKIRGIFILFSVAIFATLLNLTHLSSMCLRKGRHVSSFSNLLTSVICLISVSLWAAAGFYHRFGELTGNTPSDVMTYVCSDDLHPLVIDRMGSATVLCKEIRYAWWAVLTVVILEISVVATVAWGMLAMRKGAYARVM